MLLRRLCLLAILPTQLVAQERLRSEYLTSASLGRQVRFQVLLPAAYDSSTPYPVLWLLHGYGGSDSSWVALTHLERHAARYPMIIVMPAVQHSFYVNSPVTPNAEYETFIEQELHAAVVTRFAVDTTREAIAGVSMGGYGAAMLALRYPARYRFAGLMIPAISVPDSLQKADTAFAYWAIPALDTAFGPAPSAHRATHDPFLLLHTAQPTALPYFYVTVAQADPFPSFLPYTRKWVEALRRLGVPYEYHEMPGGHDEAAVDAALPNLLKRCWVELTTLRHGAT